MPHIRSLVLALPLLGLACLVGSAHAQDEHPVVTMVKSKVQDPAKPFALLVTFKAKPGKEKDLEAAFAPCLRATRKEAGCLAYELNRDTEDSSTYVMYEKFKSVKALSDHIKEPHTTKLLTTLATLTEGGPMAKVLTIPE